MTQILDKLHKKYENKKSTSEHDQMLEKLHQKHSRI